MSDLPAGWILQPRCRRCRKRHLPVLPCWRGAYAQEITARTLRLARRAQLDPLAAPRCVRQLDDKCTQVATTTEHDQPRSYGGDDSPANCVPACAHCNSARQNKVNPYEPDVEIRPAGVGLSDRWRNT